MVEVSPINLKSSVSENILHIYLKVNFVRNNLDPKVKTVKKYQITHQPGPNTNR